MNILIATEYYYAIPPLVRLSTELAKRGHKVNVVTSYTPTFYKFDETHDVSGVNVFEAQPHIDISHLPYTVAFPFAQIVEIIRHQGIQVCHTLMERATNSAIVSLVAKCLNVPHVHTVQGTGTRTGHMPVDLLAEVYDHSVARLIMKSAKKVIVLSESLKDRAMTLGASPNKVVVIPSGIDCSFFNPSKPTIVNEAAKIRDEMGLGESIIIGYIGRLVPVKGLKYLLMAMKEVQEKHSNTHLLIIGDGFQRPALERMAQTLKLSASFVGWKKNILPYYAVLDIFVLPSLLEGLPYSLLEAMAMGKPIIATTAGGNKDVIVNGRNGFLVPARCSNPIAFYMTELIEHDKLRKDMGTVNRNNVKERFSWESCVSKVEGVYIGLFD